MIFEYLDDRKAYGRNKAVSAVELRNYMKCTPRRLHALIYSERKAGKLICSTSTAGGGYYLPASVEDVRDFVRMQEGRIKKHAVTLRAARAFLKKYEEAICGKAH